MNKIPVTFENNGKEIKGHLLKVSGGGDSLYHLYVNNYYWGQLHHTAHGWRWSSNTNQELERYIDHFVSVAGIK